MSSAAKAAPLSVEAQAHAGLEDLPNIDPSKLTITLSQNLKPIPAPEKLVFGQTMTDHMLVINFSPEAGWEAPAIKPYAPLQLDPASSVFHYSPALFEGMKAYVGPDGTPRLFRPNLNMERMVRSADRVALPEFDSEALLTLIKKLILIDKRWIPAKEGYSMYIRPTLIGTRPALGVAASSHACLFVILSPSGPYFPTGFKPITLYAESTAVRSWPGGTGEYKLGINYAPCFKPQKEAAKRGYQQILWLLGEERRVTEVGQMNFFAVVKRDDGALDVFTPSLDGTILPGVTRNSVLALLSMLPTHTTLQSFLSSHPHLSAHQPLPRIYVSESTSLTMPQIAKWFEEGRLTEAFGTGTAAVIAPVGKIGFDGQDIVLPQMEKGDLGLVGRMMYESLVAIMEGRIEVEGWSVKCEV